VTWWTPPDVNSCELNGTIRGVMLTICLDTLQGAALGLAWSDGLGLGIALTDEAEEDVGRVGSFEAWRDGLMAVADEALNSNGMLADNIRDHGHACGSRRSDFN